MFLGDLVLVAAIVFTFRVADRLDKQPGAGYTCPEICDVDHIHYTNNKEKEEYGTDNSMDNKDIPNGSDAEESISDSGGLPGGEFKE